MVLFCIVDRAQNISKVVDVFVPVEIFFNGWAHVSYGGRTYQPKTQKISWPNQNAVDTKTAIRNLLAIMFLHGKTLTCVTKPR